MPFVIDASIAACWLLPDERHPVADAAFSRISQDQAIVPGLWWFELRNMLIVNERRGRLDGAKTAQALHLLKALPVSLDLNPEEGTLMRLAREHHLTVYDAAYLELAAREDIALATLDAALIKAAHKASVPLIGSDPIA